MKLKFIGVICIGCGESADQRIQWQHAPHENFIGKIKIFRCNECGIDHVLIYDQDMRFVTMFTELSSDTLIGQAGWFVEWPEWMLNWSPDRFKNPEYPQDERPS